MNHISKIETEITELRARLTHHELYQRLSEVTDIQIFMEKHVYAVWDFMSLLKALQNQLTGVSLPWRPAKNAKIVRFINEIVWGEESDVNEIGVPVSHFEMYLEAMQEVGANTSNVIQLINSAETLEGVHTAIAAAHLSRAEADFLTFTFDIIQTKEAHKIAAAFTFGREDLIPDMFLSIIKEASEDNKNRFPKLTYYLQRHIEVDGDEHGPLSLEMISELCGSSEQKWAEVLTVAKAALTQRIQLWDDISAAIARRQDESPIEI